MHEETDAYNALSPAWEQGIVVGAAKSLAAGLRSCESAHDANLHEVGDGVSRGADAAAAQSLQGDLRRRALHKRC